MALPIYNIRENLLAIALLPYIPGDIAKAILAPKQHIESKTTNSNTLTT